MNEKKPNPDTMTHACPNCGEPVACGNVNGCDTCWCASLPRVVPDLKVGEGEVMCLCAKCLRKLPPAIA